MLSRHSLQFLKHLKWNQPPNIKQCSCDQLHNIKTLKWCSPARHSSTVPSFSLSPDNDSWLSRKMINTRVQLGMLERPKAYYRLRGLILYESIESVNWREYFKILQIPDTFHSWFLIIELHTWMLNVRGKAEGKEGECLNKFVIQYMWEKSYKRAKKLESYNASSLREGFAILHEEFLAAFVLYDYGLLSSDTALAEAVWYRFFEENCNDPEKVELLVKHIRKQIQVLDKISRDEFIGKAQVTWLPLSDKR